MKIFKHQLGMEVLYFFSKRREEVYWIENEDNIWITGAYAGELRSHGNTKKLHMPQEFYL